LSGRGLCDELITRPEESHRLCCVVVCDLETSRMGAPYIYDISHLRVKLSISNHPPPPHSCPPIMVTEMFACSLNHVTYLSCDTSCGLDEIRQRELKGTTIVGREGELRQCSTHYPMDFIPNPYFTKDVV